MKEHVHYLQKLGLGQYESRALVVLFSKGSCAAKDVANLGEIPYTKIYQVLRNLEARGVVDFEPDTPRTYYAHGPEEVIQALLEKYLLAAKNLKQQAREHVSKIASLEIAPPEVDPSVHPVLSPALY